jgi:hypothetical protein
MIIIANDVAAFHNVPIITWGATYSPFFAMLTQSPTSISTTPNTYQVCFCFGEGDQLYT